MPVRIWSEWTKEIRYKRCVPYSDPEKKKEYGREYLAKRRAEWLEEKGPCANCGSNQELQVDHKDRNSKVTNSVWSWTKIKREAELAKCQILCKECHLKKTKEEWLHLRQHGKSRMYTDGCRCDECRAGEAKRKANWRLKSGRH